jgi:hypothetical protein
LRPGRYRSKRIVGARDFGRGHGDTAGGRSGIVPQICRDAVDPSRGPSVMPFAGATRRADAATRSAVRTVQQG